MSPGHAQDYTRPHLVEIRGSGAGPEIKKDRGAALAVSRFDALLGDTDSTPEPANTYTYIDDEDCPF